MRLSLFVALGLTLAFAGHGITGGDKKKIMPKMPDLQPLWPDGAPGALGKTDADIPGIMLYPAPADKANGTAIVVCPGGGYGGLAMDHEGDQIGKWLNKLGVTAAVLRYRLGPKYRHPIELGDAQRAIRTVRSKAAEWKLDPAKIGILGFSAGGHLASTAGTHFDAGLSDGKDAIDKTSCRPDFMVLLYPVITFHPPYAHMGSRNNLIGKDAPADLVDHLSNDKQVTKDTPPTFLAHTSEDKGVPPENSIYFYMALQKNKVPAELHIYEKGQHGLGLGPQSLPFSSWSERCEAWMRGRRLLPKN